jgi:zinc finger protein 830
MADVRALLKAKRQEARITHPYAAYGANGALRCAACGAAIKVASAWEGHLGSKAHRVAVANLKAAAAAAGAADKEGDGGARVVATSKRKAEAEGDGGEGEGGLDGGLTAMATATKRQRTAEREIAADDAAAAGDADAHAGAGAGASHSIPMDFFSDPSRAPPPRTSADENDDNDDEMDQDENSHSKPAPAPAPAPKSQFDKEWAAFEREIQGISLRRPKGADDPQETKTTTTTYAHATIAAEPELVPRFEGLPLSADGTVPTLEAAAGGVDEAGARKGSGEVEERKRKELDERELIIDRLVEEERAQEDAYGRVALLKNRIQMLKQKRELAKAKGKKAEDMET